MTNIEEKQIQLRKDTTTNLQDIVPIVAEPIYDTTKKKLAIGDGTTAFKDLPLLARDDEVEPSIALVNKTWGGRDLNTLLANESGNTIYNKLYNRAYAGNYKGLALGDYFDLALPAITITDGTTTYSIPAKTHRMRAIGYDVYRGCGWSIPNNNGANVAGHRITFMSDNTIGCNIPWQTVNNNNGTSDHKIAWLQSVVYACLNGVNNVSSNSFSGDTLGFDASSGGILQAFPEALQNVIPIKSMYMGNRYSSSQTLTACTGSADVWGLGKLWLPTEFEFYGQIIHSAEKASDGKDYNNFGATAQYPYLAGHQNSNNHKKKSAHFWLLSPCGVSSTFACVVTDYGNAGAYTCTDTRISVPLCFDIGV